MKFLIGISFFIIALVIGYYFIIYLPNQEKAQATFAQQQQQLLVECLYNTNPATEKIWNEHCRIEKREESCDLPQFRADKVKESRVFMVEQCHKIYNQ